ncbi:MAG TPA: hypothetical protein VMU34_21400 [Mycobacterium sp.]|nr:hypothetical protein [Mycobacterium sp.]
MSFPAKRTISVLYAALLAGCGGASPSMAPGDAGADVGHGVDVSAHETGSDQPTPDAPKDLGTADAAVDVTRDGQTDAAKSDGPQDAPAGTDGARVDGPATEVGPSCDPPQALLFPGSDLVSQPYDVAMAQSPTAGIGVIWSRWPEGYDPQFGIYQPTTGTFAPAGAIATGLGARSTSHVAMTTLPDGRLAAAWGANDGYVLASVGPETATPKTQIVEYSANIPVPWVDIVPFGSDRVAVAWSANHIVGAGPQQDVVDVFIGDLTLTLVNTIRIVPLAVTNAAVIPHLHATGDQLLVTIEQLLPNTTQTELSLAKIAVSDLVLTPPKHVMTLIGSASNLVFTQTALAFTYGAATDLALDTFDFDGNPVGTPRPLMLNGDMSGGVDRLVWDGTSYQLLWADSVPGPVYRILRYAKLDSNFQASPFVTIAGMNVPRSTGLFKAGSGLAVGWFSSAGVYLSPLCP